MRIYPEKKITTISTPKVKSDEGGDKMPVKIIKTKGGYKVKTPKMVHAQKTTKTKAEAQRRLLNAVEHGWKPTRK